MRPYLENKTKSKRTGDMTQVVECLPSKHEALSTKKKKKKNGEDVEKLEPSYTADWNVKCTAILE
jgi:hypothetical protein